MAWNILRPMEIVPYVSIPILKQKQGTAPQWTMVGHRFFKMKKHVLIHKQVAWTWNQVYFSTLITNVNIVFLLKIRNAFHVILTVLTGSYNFHIFGGFLCKAGLRAEK